MTKKKVYICLKQLLYDACELPVEIIQCFGINEMQEKALSMMLRTSA